MTPGADTWAPPLRSTFPAGHDVFATRTVPRGGSGADTTGIARSTFVPANPAGPCLPSGPCGPCGPTGPTGPRDPCGPVGPETCAGCVAKAYTPTPKPATPSTKATTMRGVIQLTDLE